jgi:uncharacterized protein YkwD
MSRHPKLTRIPLVSIVAAALLLSVPGASATAAPVHRSTRLTIGSEAWQMLKATNASRGRFELPTLRLNRELSLIARRHSLAMARNDRLFHTTDVDVYLQGITWHVWGENVGYTPGDVDSLEKAFMNSTEHRDNILNRAFHHVAIGAVRVDGTLWVTVFFYG